ncbi:hypothetical protein ACFLX2_00560 [Candidatus Dependentiae bacterium]
MKDRKAFSEVIESSLHGFLAQCWQWDDFPSFGQLVTIESGSRTIFGLVYQIRTGSMDPVRYPFPYQKTEKELLEEQPQIFEFLKTTFSCLIVGYQEKQSIFYLLAPKPPNIHAFVSHADNSLAKQFFLKLDYLHLLFGQSGLVGNLDELLLALLKQQASLGMLTEKKMETFIDSFSLLTGNDYRRLKLFLQRAEPLVAP